MHRNDKSNFLLYIEPKVSDKLETPINDEVTLLMDTAFQEATKGCANYSVPYYIDTSLNSIAFRSGDGYRGEHGTDCGESSDNHDYLLKNGLIVNSLCIFYVKWYRNSIHENDWMKLKELSEFYNVKINIPDKFPDSPPSTKKDIRNSMEKLKDIMVDELSKNISRNIVDRIKKLANDKK